MNETIEYFRGSTVCDTFNDEEGYQCTFQECDSRDGVAVLVPCDGEDFSGEALCPRHMHLCGVKP